MPLLTLHLVRFKNKDQTPASLTKQLTATDPSIKIIVSSKPRYPVVNSTNPSTSFLNNPWDLMLLVQTSTGSLPSSLLTKLVASEYKLSVGIPSKLLSGYPSKNAQLLKEASSAGLTGSLDNPKVPESSQRLELSPGLLEFMDDLGKEYTGPVTMLNLLRFNDGGKEGYYRYGQEFIKVAGKRGGDAKIVGNVVTEDKSQGYWHEVAIVHYASIKHFCDMLAGEDYQAINEKFRLPALEDTLLICTTEFGLEGEKAKL